MKWRNAVVVGIGAVTLACSGLVGPSEPEAKTPAPDPKTADAPKPDPADAPAPAGSSADPTDADLKVSTDPLVLAGKLAQVEKLIRDPSVADATAGKWGHVQQRIYRALAGDEVLANAVMKSIP